MNWEEFCKKIISLGYTLNRIVYPRLGCSINDGREEIYYISESYLHRNIDWEKDFQHFMKIIEEK